MVVGLLRSLRKLVGQCFLFLMLSLFLLLNYISDRRLKSKAKTNNRNAKLVTPSTDQNERNGIVSIVIAAKNESRTIGATLRNLESTTIDKARCEIILVDAGCSDNTIAVAKGSSCCIPLRCVKQKSAGDGRGVALDEGFNECKGDIVLFLRSDCLVPPGFDETLRREMINGTTLLASFRFGVDRRELVCGSEPLGLWLLEEQMNIRSMLFSLPVGSQGLALRSDVYKENRFHQGEFLEDIDLVSRIRLVLVFSV